MKNPLPTNWDAHWSTVSKKNFIERYRIRLVWQGYRRLLQGINLPQNPRVLELGAGSGHSSMRFIQHYGGRATLVELNAQAVAFSKKIWQEAKLQNQVTHFHGSLFDFSDDEGFDVVHSGGVIEHFHGEDKKRVVEAHVNAVKPNGKLVIIVPVDGWRYRLFKGFLSVSGKWIYTDEVVWKPHEAEKWFGEYGFKLIRKAIIQHEMGYLFERTDA